jgi:hypothetical protein
MTDGEQEDVRADPASAELDASLAVLQAFDGYDIQPADMKGGWR